MHRIIYNELRLDFSLIPVSPLSIPAIPANATLLTSPGSPARFVRSAHPSDGTPSAYIPGSTLKGALRHAAEQVAQASGVDCCDTDHPCSERDGVRRSREATVGGVKDSGATY